MKILAIDYGLKRTGIAATDEMQIIASGLGTVNTADLAAFLDEYLVTNKLECIVVGQPRYMNGTPMEIEKDILSFIKKFRNKYPAVPVKRVDERFTSKMAMQSMVDGGMKKKARKDKALLDEISATIILQSYLQSRP